MNTPTFEELTPIRRAIIDEARTYLRTPFHHQARLKKIGVDCVGLVVGVAKALGLSDADCTTYPRRPNGQLVPELERAGYQALDLEEAAPGDLVLFWISSPKRPQHVGILTEKGVIHTNADVGFVCEHGFVGEWPEKVTSAYLFPGVEQWRP